MAILCQKMKPIRQKELPTPSKQVSPYIIIKKNKDCEEIIIYISSL